MKTGYKQLAAALFLAVFFAAGNSSAKGTEVYASSHEEVEETMELENWMVNEYFWNENETIEIEVAQDFSLEVENWMTNKNNWETKSIASVENDSDSNLELESWMMNEYIWIR